MEACPHIRYAFQNDKLLLQQASVGRLTLVNKTTILLRPMKTTTVDLGLYARPPEGHGLMLWGSTSRPVTSHVGIIDPGYTGELRLILQNQRRYNSTLRPSELKIHLAAFRYATPQMEEDKGPINHPQYPGDVGLDVSLPKDLALFPHQTVSVTLTVPPPSIPHHRPTIFGRSGLAWSKKARMCPHYMCRSRTGPGLQSGKPPPRLWDWKRRPAAPRSEARWRRGRAVAQPLQTAFLGPSPFRSKESRVLGSYI